MKNTIFVRKEKSCICFVHGNFFEPKYERTERSGCVLHYCGPYSAVTRDVTLPSFVI